MLTVEPPPWRRRLVFVAILAVGIAVFTHTWLTDRHLTFVSAVHRANNPVQTPLQRIRPAFTADVSMWIRYSLAVLEGKEGLRVRHTDVDNAPAGREVHWNSGLTLWLAGLGWSWHQLSGTPLPAAVERAAGWANFPIVLAFIAGFGWWAGRRAGAIAGALVAVAIFCHRSIYEGFLPAYPDHHGLIAGAILGVMLGLLFMGGGWTRGPDGPGGLLLLPESEPEARRAARWGGFWGGFGLWISTASLAIPLATVALASVFATLACRGSLIQSGAKFNASVWRTWGRTGALTSVAFYLLEYFPFHLGWRLEVNHPLYALAWWAGAEFTAALLTWLVAEPAERAPARQVLFRRAAWTLPLSVLPALVILLGGTRVFSPSDPFLTRLHGTIAEFLPFLTRIGMDSITDRLDYAIIYPMFYVAALVLLFLAPRARRYPLVLCLVPAVTLQALGFWQGRWGMSAGSAQVPLLLACLSAAFAFSALGSTARRRWIVAGAAAVFFFSPAPVYYFKNLLFSLRHNIVPVDETLELVYREIAQNIRQSQPQGPIVLFASPNASLSIGYYGRFQTLGTLYWENTAGLKSAAALSAATNEEAAASLIRRHGVTHLALVSRDNYIEEYAKFLNPGLSSAGVERTFAYQLLIKGQIPVWLEPIVYRPPADLVGNIAGLRVLLLRVNFQQNETTLYYRLGLLLTLLDQTEDALQRFARAAQLDPKSPAPWLRRFEILLKQKKFREAAVDLERAVDLAAPTDRYGILTQGGIGFEQGGEITLAVTCYRLAIALPMTNAIALNNLAWRLATASQADQRNPAAALALAQNACTIEPDAHSCHNTLAAALAANQRYPEAITASEQAIALATKAGDQAVLKIYERHLAAYRAGLPWRE